MPKTKASAVKEARTFLKRFPDRDVLVIENVKFKSTSDLKYNFRFPKKKMRKNKILFTKEF